MPIKRKRRPDPASLEDQLYQSLKRLEADLEAFDLDELIEDVKATEATLEASLSSLPNARKRRGFGKTVPKLTY
jgi:hemerythrin superfamily protein